MIEIELKFAIKLAPSALGNFPLIKEKSQLDIYYDTADYTLLRRGGFLRVRNNTRLDFKGDPACDASQHDYCNETSFDIASISQKSAEINLSFVTFGLQANGEYKDFSDMLTQNKLQPLAVIDKARQEYKINENITVALDEAKDIGLFLEAEITVPDNTSKEEIQKHIEQMRVELTAFGILTEDATPVHVGYVELYLFKHNRAAHDVGLYKV